VYDSVSWTEIGLVTQERQPGKGPFPKRIETDLPIAGDTNERDPERLQELERVVKLPSCPSVGDVTGNDHQLGMRVHKIGSQRVQSVGDHVAAEMEV